jgi:hypothetical protein
MNTLMRTAFPPDDKNKWETMKKRKSFKLRTGHNNIDKYRWQPTHLLKNKREAERTNNKYLPI